MVSTPPTFLDNFVSSVFLLTDDFVVGSPLLVADLVDPLSLLAFTDGFAVVGSALLVDDLVDPLSLLAFTADFAVVVFILASIIFVVPFVLSVISS